MKHEIKFKPVAARDGVRWARQGLSVYVRQPLAFALLMMVWLLLLLITALPVLGVLAVMSMPILGLGFMLATHKALQGKVPRPSVFIFPLRITRARTRSLLALGGLYALGSMAILMLCHLGDGGAFAALSEAMVSGAGEGADEAARTALINARFDDPQLRLWLWMRLAGLSLLSLLFWFAPALVHWGGHSAGKALFFSALACWRNKAAFAVYGLMWVVLALGVSMLSSIALIVLGPLAPMVAIPLVLSGVAAFYASHFFTFLDTFALVSSGAVEPLAAGQAAAQMPAEPQAEVFADTQPSEPPTDKLP